MRLPDNLSAKEKKEWISKYKAMGIKIDTSKREKPKPREFAWTNNVPADGFDLLNIDKDAIKMWEGYGETTEPPIGIIIPAIYGEKAMKAHMKEVEQFIKDDWDDFSIDFAKRIIRVHKKMGTLELYKKILKRFNESDCIDDDIPTCLILHKMKATPINDWEIQGIDLEAEFYID